MTAETTEMTEAPPEPETLWYEARNGEVLGLTAGPHAICEEALAACPAMADYLARYTEIAAIGDWHGPEFKEHLLAEARLAHEEHLALLPDIPPGSPEYLIALRRAEGEVLTGGWHDDPAASQPLEPLPPEHPWMDQMTAEFAAEDEEADAAVTRYMAVHDEFAEEDGHWSGNVRILPAAKGDDDPEAA